MSEERPLRMALIGIGLIILLFAMYELAGLWGALAVLGAALLFLGASEWKP